jgi:hemerythrin
MEKDIEAGNIVLSMDLQQFLRQWLMTHIMQRDKKYTPSLQAAGIR